MTDSDQSEFLEALARSVRLAHQRIDAAVGASLENLLGVGGPLHTGIGPVRGLGGVPAGLTGRVNESGPSFSLGNVQPFIGQTNALPDPAWQGLDSDGVTTGTGVTRVSGSWSCHHVLNSGVLPTTHVVRGGYYPRGSNPFNSDQIAVEFSGFGANACDVVVFLYPTGGFNPGSTQQEILPYLVAAVRESRVDDSFGDATISVTLQIVRVDTGAVVAESDPLDPGGTALTEVRQLLTSTTQTAAVFNGTSWRWRLRVHVVKPATTTTGIALTFGEPMLHFAYTPDALAYSPIIAGWHPERLFTEVPSSTNTLFINSRLPSANFDRFAVQPNGNISWGDGTAATDVGLRRSAAGELLMEGGAIPVTVKLVGKRVAVPKATQTLVAATAIVADYEVVQIDSAGAVTMTATPTIADGVDGQLLTILNVDTADAVTLQDQGTLAGSNLRLTAATVAVGPRDSIQLIYSATIGDWVQIGNLVSVL